MKLVNESSPKTINTAEASSLLSSNTMELK